MIYPPAIYAQLPRGLERCFDHPTLAEEIKEMQEEQEAARPKVHVVGVTFEGARDLPLATRMQLTREMEHTRYDLGTAWPPYFAERVRDALQQYGYFYASVAPQASALRHDSAGERVSVTVRVTEGQPYRLAGIQFAGAHVFPFSKLRAQIPLQEGHVFDVVKLREGIAALTRLYGTRGYINFVATPDVHVNRAAHSISLLMQLDEGAQFRVGRVQVLGLSQQVLNRGLKLEPKPSAIFSPELVEEFFKANKSVLPAAASLKEDTEITQDSHNHTVAIAFDFRCLP